MARPRTPSNILALRGSFVKHPERQRERADEPVDNRALGPPPGYFNAEQRVAWGEIERNSAPGVLTAADAIAVELAAVALERFRRLSGLGAPTVESTERRLQSLLADLGMTPAARSKVKALPATSENPFLSNGVKPKDTR